MAFPSLILTFVLGMMPLEAVRNADLAVALTYHREISDKSSRPRSAYRIRVFQVPTSLGECGGQIDSCPDVILYLTVSAGDLDETPSLFRLPPAKGWAFVGWLTTCPSMSGVQQSGFRVRTTLPGANIAPSERSRWVAEAYGVCADMASGSFSVGVAESASPME